MPASAEGCSKPSRWNEFGTQLFTCDKVVGVPDKTQSAMNFFPSPLEGEHCFFGLVRGKLWKMSKTGLSTERQQRWSFFGAAISHVSPGLRQPPASLLSKLQ